MNQKLGRRRKRSGAKMGEPFQGLVADVVKVFHPKAKIDVGQWVEGPDGRRELDVAIRGQINGRSVFVLIECKDYTYTATPTPVGIGDIDAFESKRRDLGADFAIVASNSGFTVPALQKTSRTNIGAIAVLKEGDSRAKARILHAVFLRKITADGRICFYYLNEDGRPVSISNVEYGSAEINGESIDSWLVMQAINFQVMHPWEQRGVRLNFRFSATTTAVHRDRELQLSELVVRFKWNTQWLRQAVQLDALTGIVDYLSARLLFPRGENRLMFRDINFETAEPCEPPTQKEYRFLQELGKGEISMQLCMVTLPPGTREVPANSAISKLVVPEDMAEIFAPLDPALSAS